MSFHVQRVASKFAPSTLQRYFDVWLNWVSFCKLCGVNHLCPPPGLLPDWPLSGQQTTMQLKSLAWFCEVAGLPLLKAALFSPVCEAFASPSAPVSAGSHFR